MFATRLTGQITRDRRLVVEIPKEVTTGAVEVILLQTQPAPSPRRRLRRKIAHPAFGIWAQRDDITDSAAFAAQLRQRLERHEEANG